MEAWEIKLSHEELVEQMRAYMGTYQWQHEELWLAWFDVRLAVVESFGLGWLGRCVARMILPADDRRMALRLEGRHNLARALLP